MKEVGFTNDNGQCHCLLPSDGLLWWLWRKLTLQSTSKWKCGTCDRVYTRYIRYTCWDWGYGERYWQETGMPRPTGLKDWQR